MPNYGPPPPHPSYSHPPAPPRYYDSHPEDEYAPPEMATRQCAPTGFMQGEQVEVRIRGNIWIVGFLVSSLHLISSYLGHGYDVEYQRSGHAYRAPFRAEDVRPFPPR